MPFKYSYEELFVLLLLMLFSFLICLTQILADTVKAEKSKPNLPQLGSTSSIHAVAPRKISSLTVVYTKHTLEGSKIAWRTFTSSKEHIIYRTERKKPTTDSLGYLPSPNGQWLVVWDYLSRNGRSHTLWFIIRLSDSKTLKLADTPELPNFLPYWQDSRHLIIEGIGSKAIFDISKETLLQPLPRIEKSSLFLSKPSDYEELYARSKARLLEYCNHYYAKSWQVWNTSLKRLEKQLDLEGYYFLFGKEPLQYIILRSVGIPGLSLLRYDQVGHRIRSRIALYLACSPDGKLVAFADNLLSSLSADSGKKEMTDLCARLRVFKTESKAVIWDTRIPVRKLPLNRQRAARSNPPPASFTSPEYRDIRFDSNGQFLSFTTTWETPKSGWTIKVIDTLKFKEALRIENARNAFIINTPLVSRKSVQ